MKETQRVIKQRLAVLIYDLEDCIKRKKITVDTLSNIIDRIGNERYYLKWHLKELNKKNK